MRIVKPSVSIESNISYGEDYAPTIIGAPELGGFVIRAKIKSRKALPRS